MTGLCIFLSDERRMSNPNCEALRQIVLDTETTGLETTEGHRIIEIGAVELIDRRVTGNHYHCYINPEREVDQGALEVHGITNEFLADKPTFAEEVDQFLAFIKGAELVIHNADFDVGFINHELSMLGDHGRLEDHVSGVVDSLAVARKKHPGQRNSLDALCRRYGIDNSSRQLHGALLDSEILADVYLAMTGGQSSLMLASEEGDSHASEGIRRLPADRPRLKVTLPSEAEAAAHDEYLAMLDKASGEKTLWRRMVGEGAGV